MGAYSPSAAQRLVDESWPTHGVATAAYSREKAYVERLLDGLEREQPDLRVVRQRPAFTFRQESAVQQRRLFGGPCAPARMLFRKLRLRVLHDAVEAVQAFLAGVESGRGAPTPPLAPATSGRLRSHEVATGMGETD